MLQPAPGSASRGPGMRVARCRARAGPLSPALPPAPPKVFPRCSQPGPGQRLSLPLPWSPLSSRGLWGFPGVRNPRGPRRSQPLSAQLLAGESCGSKLAFPLRPLGVLLPSGAPAPTAGFSGLLGKLGPRSRCRDGRPGQRWEVSNPNGSPFSQPNGRFPRGGSSTRRGQASLPRPHLKGARPRGPSVLVALPVSVSPLRLPS